jgi:hypothetical protein
MTGNQKSNDDLTMGRHNQAQDPTHLLANQDGHSWGNDLGEPQGPVLDVDAGDTQAAYAIQATASQHGIAGISTSGFNGIKAECNAKGGKAVWALGGALSTGVHGSGDPGVRGDGESKNGNGVEGQSSATAPTGRACAVPAPPAGLASQGIATWETVWLEPAGWAAVEHSRLTASLSYAWSRTSAPGVSHSLVLEKWETC